MGRTTKGALAAAAAAVLLLGGAGTIAYWTDAETADGGSVDSGSLSLGVPTCDTDWVYAAGSAGAGTTVVEFVPGDVVTKECSFTVEASGDNLSATLAAPSTVPFVSPVGTSLTATVGVSYAIDGTPLATPATITPANDGDTVVATIDVDLPFGTDETGSINKNDMQGITAALDGIDITLTQIDPNP